MKQEFRTELKHCFLFQKCMYWFAKIESKNQKQKVNPILKSNSTFGFDFLKYASFQICFERWGIRDGKIWFSRKKNCLILFRTDIENSSSCLWMINESCFRLSGSAQNSILWLDSAAMFPFLHKANKSKGSILPFFMLFFILISSIQSLLFLHFYIFSFFASFQIFLLSIDLFKFGNLNTVLNIKQVF